MKAFPALAVLAFVLAAPAHAQPRAGVLNVDSVEAVVTVVKVDQANRVVVVRGPRGNLAAIQVPPEAQNLDQVAPGARLRMRYVEALAISIAKGGKPSADVTEAVQLAPKGGTPGGIAARTFSVSGVVDAIDYDSRYITMRGPKGTGVRSFRVPESVKNLEQINGGDRITVSHTEALAIRMLPAGK